MLCANDLLTFGQLIFNSILVSFGNICSILGISFSFIVKNHGNIVRKLHRLNKNVDNFYLDSNSIVYDCLRALDKEYKENGEEFMAHAQLLAIDSSLKIEVGKRSVTLKPKDWSEYILSRAKRGKKVGKLINIERLTEKLKSAED